MSDKVSDQEALIYVMVMISAVDRRMTDKEMARIGAITRTLPAFDDFDEDQLVPISRDCAALLDRDDGLATALDLIAWSLPQSLYETAYALGVDIAATELALTPEEARLLQLLRRKFGLDRLVTVAIERGARARHARAVRHDA